MTFGGFGGAEVDVPEAERPFVHDQQLALPGMGPMIGDQYKRNDGRAIATVIATHQRRHAWVTVRIYGRPQLLKLETFERQFTRL